MKRDLLSEETINGAAQVIQSTYGPTLTGKKYFIHLKHRGGVPAAAQWHPSITYDGEYGLFKTADEAGWQDGQGNIWSVRPGAGETGTRGERIAKHPATTNLSDPWHGYPASPAYKGHGDLPPDEVIDAWGDAGLITRSFRKRLKSQKF